MAWTKIIDSSNEIEKSNEIELIEKDNCIEVLKEILSTLKEIHSCLTIDKKEEKEEPEIIILNERK